MLFRSRWMLFPLKDTTKINKRLDVVDYFFRYPTLRDLVEEHLHHIGDLERIIGRMSTGRVNPRDVIQLSNALQAMVTIKQECYFQIMSMPVLFWL